MTTGAAPDCPYCEQPIVDPRPSPLNPNEDWCRHCCVEFESFEFGAAQTAPVAEKKKKKRKEPEPFSIGGDGRF